MPVEKAKDFKNAMKRLVQYLAPYRAAILLVFGMAILSTGFSVAGPKILGSSITILFEGVMAVARGIPGAAIDFTRIGTILLSLLGLYLVAAGFSYATQLVMAGVSQKTVYSFRKAIDDKLARLPLRYYDEHTHGDILSRVTNDVDVIANTLQQSLVQIITSVVTLIGSIAMMFSISWKLSLVTRPPSLLHTDDDVCSQALSRLLQESAEILRRAQRPCRGDVFRSSCRQGIWLRGTVGPAFR
ncbi:hypothetical protein MASR2M48_18360 [Spirochaetota bacterium]